MERKRGSAPTRGRLDGSINLRALQLASHVELHGSIRLAAQTARLSPSVVSRRIRGLEGELGVSLFERRLSGIRTTAAGEGFLRAALRMFGELDGATCAARAAGSGLVGQPVVGTYFSASIGRFRDALLRFVGRHQGVDLSVIEGDRAQLLGDLRRGRADVAILLGPHDEPGVDRLALRQEAGMVALPERHPLAGAGLVLWQDLASEPFIVASRGSGTEVRATVRGLLAVRRRCLRGAPRRTKSGPQSLGCYPQRVPATPAALPGMSTCRRGCGRSASQKPDGVGRTDVPAASSPA
jgi:DNA-binding transcriptional LysR family regulator